MDQLTRAGFVFEAGPQLRRLQVGAMAGLLRPGPRRVVRAAPAVLMVEGVAQRVEGLLPAGRRDVQAAARLQVAPGGEDVHVDPAAALVVQDRRPGVAVRLQSRPRCSFEFLVLTACRSGEVRGARWEEMDLEAREWRVPAERMKTNRIHRVPLSTGALAVLREARRVVDDSDLVFPSVRGRPLSDATISKMVRELGIGAVPHGFRSSFRDWAAECSDAPREVCELALAHVNTDRVEAAYRRTDLFERRRELMEEWAAFLARS